MGDYHFAGVLEKLNGKFVFKKASKNNHRYDIYPYEGRGNFSFIIYGIRSRNTYTAEELIERVFRDPKPTLRKFQEAVRALHPFYADSVIEDFVARLKIPKKDLLSVGSYFTATLDDKKMSVSYVPRARLGNLVPQAGALTPSAVKQQQTFPVGRFLRQLFPNATDAEIEDKVAASKAIILANRIVLEEYDDDRILWAYHVRNYDTQFDIGRMRGSCMQSESNQSQIQWYVNNPNVKLLVATRGEGKAKKVVGRVVVWTGDDGKRAVSYYYAGAAVSKLFEDYRRKHNIESCEWMQNNLVVSHKFERGTRYPSLDGTRFSRDENKIVGYSNRRY